MSSDCDTSIAGSDSCRDKFMTDQETKHIIEAWEKLLLPKEPQEDNHLLVVLSEEEASPQASIIREFKVGDIGLEDQDGRGRRSTFKNDLKFSY
ncbi:hypothetical protein LAZ67_1006940 [Cordylochernes scorpioides]|uniref:Uncharacterized protein n=1 Tax=Cordylochernes scorpioides TaxID=51811 RepID=A0ABY6JZS9_9ARAC|nr:hypothetical protein LAZ67_1006940 [Cordylochernes scorpioides]